MYNIIEFSGVQHSDSQLWTEKKMHNLKVENYVILGRLSED